MTTTTTYTALINLYAHHLTGLRDELMNIAQFPLTAARNSLIAINNAVELACHDAGKNWGPILSEGVNIKAASRAKFIQRITEALEGLEGLKAALIKYSGEDARQAKAEAEADQVSTCFARGSDVLEDSGVHVALPVCTDQSPESHQAVESEFITRIVTALDDAPMGTHGVYVHWFRIDYGCWLDAEEVANAGGLAEYLEESLGLSAADVAELMTRDWDCQDAEGLALRCLGNYGGFDWLKLEELLEVNVEPAVLAAGLACGLEPDAIEDAYMGEWDSDEDMAFDQWEQGGMLESIPEAARGYIDWELVARDLLIAGSVTEANGHYFHAA
ncbi:Antirestriction protein (ArdA) [compost metagenome]